MSIPLVIVGTGDYADVAFTFLAREEKYRILGFSEESAFIRKRDFHRLPISRLEDLSSQFDCNTVEVLVAVGPNRINTVRERLFNVVKESGFRCIRYSHPSAYVWDQNAIGENTFIFPGCVVEPYAQVGKNSVLWSGCVVAHHSVIGDHCFMAPGSKVSGRVTVENNCFLGINSTIRDHVTLASCSLVGAGAVIKNDTEKNGVYPSKATRLRNNDSLHTKV